jgi:hypothetical protein
MPIDIKVVKEKARAGKFIISDHADDEAADENIDIAEIQDAILADDILEQYPDTGRGESCLILGFVAERPIHAVCGWRRDSVLIVTVYEPKLPHFIDPRTRREKL